MSGVDINGQKIRKGSADVIKNFVGGTLPEDVQQVVDSIAQSGGTPLVVAENARVLGSHPFKGHRQGRPEGPLRAVPGHGHQDRHDYR